MRVREVDEDEQCTRQMLRLLNQLYLSFMKQLHADWRDNHRTVVEFQEVSESMLARCMENPVAFLGTNPKSASDKP